jgi:hypothetical protein
MALVQVSSSGNARLEMGGNLRSDGGDMPTVFDVSGYSSPVPDSLLGIKLVDALGIIPAWGGPSPGKEGKRSEVGRCSRWKSLMEGPGASRRMEILLERSGRRGYSG